MALLKAAVRWERGGGTYPVTDARSDRFSGSLDLIRPLLQRRRRLGHALGDDVGDCPS
ncbi:hypothetical protein [Sphingomonas sp.]|jgi:hypothetical protein|uniref:hypothetical protein n=1 Tax=Sphingomonas sp. TaxID=28214 RepID=UPI002E0EAAE2|nr:hypothetical protein [Sphingomonas sp.]